MSRYVQHTLWYLPAIEPEQVDCREDYPPAIECFEAPRTQPQGNGPREEAA
ncbi:hypothetical protein ERY430_80255 [Erythrobacter sp. EC-HK427]|nr:hypothetical protein ERY430_80255 [Erythrobacter sp. EC-HK427]